MTECIAMAVGVILGAGIMSYKFRVMNPAERDVMMKPQASVAPEGAERDVMMKPETAVAPEGAEREKMQKQWENFLNYSGNSDGQVEINEE